jgi:predicted Fe-Mo cluster-binding NifX family protein
MLKKHFHTVDGRKYMNCRIGVATSDNVVVNQHFGRADKFLIVDVDGDDMAITEERYVKPVCDGGEHDDNRLDVNAELLGDCDYLLVSKIGNGAQAVLESKGIEVYEIPDFIEDAITKLLAYVEIQNLIQ